MRSGKSGGRGLVERRGRGWRKASNRTAETGSSQEMRVEDGRVEAVRFRRSKKIKRNPGVISVKIDRFIPRNVAWDDDKMVVEVTLILHKFLKMRHVQWYWQGGDLRHVGSNDFVETRKKSGFSFSNMFIPESLQSTPEQLASCISAIIVDKIFEVSVIGELYLRRPPESEVVVNLSVDESFVSFFDAGQEMLSASQSLFVRRNVSLDLSLVQDVTQISESLRHVDIAMSC
jgi:hypothetical protein